MPATSKPPELLTALLAQCESDTAELLGKAPANRLAKWRGYADDRDELVAFVRRVLRGDSRENGWELDQQGGLSLERIALAFPDLFNDDDIAEAKRTLGIEG
jgi:hypothetical protein